MSARYIASGADINEVRRIIQQLPQNAGICFKEDTQSVVLIDPATGDEITLGTFSGDPGDIDVAEDEIIVGQAGDVGASVPMSGDAEIDATGAVTVTGVNGAALTGDGTAIQAALDLIAGISTVNVASPEIWNDGGVLKVGSA